MGIQFTGAKMRFLVNEQIMTFWPIKMTHFLQERYTVL